MEEGGEAVSDFILYLGTLLGALLVLVAPLVVISAYGNAAGGPGVLAVAASLLLLGLLLIWVCSPV